MSPLPEEWNIPASIRNRLGSTVGRQRVIFEDGHLLLVLHAPAKPDESRRRGRYFWRSPNGTWKSIATDRPSLTLEEHIDEFDHALEECEQADLKAKSSFEYFDVLEKLAPLQRSGNNMYQVLQEARKLVQDDRDIINLRDRCYELTRTAELLFTSAKNALDCTVAREAEKMTQESHKMAVSAHRLNLLVAFFFPIATLSAIFSTAFESGFEQYAPPLPFLILVAVGLIFGILLSLFVTRK